MSNVSRCITGILLLSASFLICAPAPAHAIPVAGDYEFTSGLTGNFTSDGSQLTSWNFSDPVGSMIWSNTSSSFQNVSVNNTSSFASNINVGGITNYYYISLLWDNGSYSFFLDSVKPIQLQGTATWQVTTAVVEPSPMWLVAMGLLAVLGYGYRQRRGLAF